MDAEKSEHDQHDRDRWNKSGRFASEADGEAYPEETTSESTLDKGGDRPQNRWNDSGRFASESDAEADPDGTSLDHV